MDTKPEKKKEPVSGNWFTQAQLEHLSLPTFTLDTEGRLEACNVAFEDFFGFSREFMLGKTAIEVLSPEHAKLCFDNDMRALREGGENKVECVMPVADGQVRRYRLHQSAIRDDDGNVMGLVCQVVDSTDGLKDQLSLRETERLYAQTIDSLDGMLSVITPDLRVRMSNWKGHEFIPEEERDSMPHCYSAFKGFDKPCDGCAVLKVFEDGKKRHVQDRNPIDGAFKSITMVPMFGDDGRVEYVIEYVRDVTERMQAERVLAETHERLKNHIENSPLAVIEWHKGRSVSAWSRQAEKLFGWTKDEVLGKHWKDFKCTYPDDEEMVTDKVNLLFSGEISSNTIECRNYRKDGSVIHCRWFNSSIMDAEGNMVTILSQVADMTELKNYEQDLLRAREQAEEASRAKSEFLANMSHEIRTPLNGVIGMLQVLDMTDLDGEQSECVDYALQSSRRLSQLLADILDLSRVEAGKMYIAEEPFSTADVMDSVQRLFDPVAREKGLELRFATEPSIPATLLGDAVRLQQVIGNLVGNAIKFTNMGSITVNAVSLPAEEVGDHRVSFSVEDTGIGINDKALSKLFKPFSQVEGDFTRSFQGAGLGLSICKRLVTLMGGEISVESEENTGSRFQVSIPFRAAGQQSGAAVEKAAMPSDHLRIIVAEDDPVSRDLMERLFTKGGHKVQVAEDGEALLALVRDNECDLVLMDVQMPVMNGVDATAAIRRGEAGEAARNIPVIAMTAYAMVGDREKFLAAGMDGYLAKPVDFEELWRIVDTVMATGRE